MIKHKIIFNFVVLRKSDFEKMRSELENLRIFQWKQEWYEPLYDEVKAKLDQTNERIEELEKYKKLYADEVQKRIELIRLMENKHET